MNPYNLPNLGIISNVNKDIFGRDGILKGKKLLCIGFSEEEVDVLIAKYCPDEITLLTNWVDHCDAKIEKYKLCIGDITKKTEFEDNSFDMVLSLSVLEHLSNIHSAFSEMHRILKNDGEALHFFGPTWSCAYGHHLYIEQSDPLLNFSLWNMPAHMHLLCSKNEISNFYKQKGYNKSTIDLVIYQMFESDIINRNTIDDYNNLFINPDWDIESYERMYNRLPESHEKQLQEQCPYIKDFSTYGLKVRLKKS